MAIQDRWTLAQLRSALRLELIDPTGTKPWSWTDSELNTYVEWWQQNLQNRFEFEWGTATTTWTASVGTYTMTDIATDIHRIDRIFWDNKRLTPKSTVELDSLQRDWRAVNASVPLVAYQEDYLSLSLYPVPADARVVEIEYPKIITFNATDTNTMQIPSWTKYSILNYGGYKCYERAGPNQDVDKATRYKKLYEIDINNFSVIRHSVQPEKYISLRPGGKYERDILQPQAPLVGVTMPGPITRPNEIEQTPTGTINGVNLTFTLTNSPNPTTSLLLFKDGLLQLQGTHYTLSASTITFISPYQPATGQDLFCTYRYLA